MLEASDEREDAGLERSAEAEEFRFDRHRINLALKAIARQPTAERRDTFSARGQSSSGRRRNFCLRLLSNYFPKVMASVTEELIARVRETRFADGQVYPG